MQIIYKLLSKQLHINGVTEHIMTFLFDKHCNYLRYSSKTTQSFLPTLHKCSIDFQSKAICYNQVNGYLGFFFEKVCSCFPKLEFPNKQDSCSFDNSIIGLINNCT